MSFSLFLVPLNAFNICSIRRGGGRRPPHRATAATPGGAPAPPGTPPGLFKGSIKSPACLLVLFYIP